MVPNDGDDRLGKPGDKAESRTTVAAQAEPTTLSKLPDVDVLQLWAEYEKVAMHFNELLVQWRQRAMGGLATLVTLAGFVVGDAETAGVRYRAMIILSGTLLFVWTGVALMDLKYYRLLLKGAVVDILALEDQTGLKLSTEIERHAKRGAEHAPVLFYVAGWLPLSAIVIYGFVMYPWGGEPDDDNKGPAQCILTCGEESKKGPDFKRAFDKVAPHE